METRVLAFGGAAIAEAAQLIVAGEPVAVPTETVYGLAADATSEAAVALIYQAKGRPSFNPLIVHVKNNVAAEAIGIFNGAALRLADRHWPGPLTLVVPLRPNARIASNVTAGLSTVALRVPEHRAMQALLAATDRPLAAPSANASGTISPTSAAHVLRTLYGRIPLVIDDGSTACGIESTIVAVDDRGVRLLRPGVITIDGAVASASETIEAPGQMAAHYAPAKPLRLNADSPQDGEVFIDFGAPRSDLNLSLCGDLDEAAANLFALLHAADASPAPRIAIAPIPEHGAGIAINDRLRRAAAGAP